MIHLMKLINNIEYHGHDVTVMSNICLVLCTVR